MNPKNIGIRSFGSWTIEALFSIGRVDAIWVNINKKRIQMSKEGRKQVRCHVVNEYKTSLFLTVV